METDVVELMTFALNVPAAVVAGLAAMLPPDELDAATTLRSPGDRRRYVVAHAVTRLVLGERLGLPPRALRLPRGPHGKPYVAAGQNAQDLRFNLSHSDELAVLALARGREIGVDIERLRDYPAATRIAKRHFTPVEVRLVAASTACFFRLWTRKEAMVKGAGLPLARGLGVRVYHTLERPAMVHDPRIPGEWWISEFPGRDGDYVGALAIAGQVN